MEINRKMNCVYVNEISSLNSYISMVLYSTRRDLFKSVEIIEFGVQTQKLWTNYASVSSYTSVSRSISTATQCTSPATIPKKVRDAAKQK